MEVQPNYTRGSLHVQPATVYAFPALNENGHAANGRVYRGVAIIGGLPSAPSSDLAHAAASYGAAGEQDLRVHAPVEGLFRFQPVDTVEFSPWTPVPAQQASPASDAFSRAHQKLARRAEDARQAWLKDNNYTGGVRTHVNDAAPGTPTTKRPEPRGIIELAPEVPAFRSKMHVKGVERIQRPMKLAANQGLIKVIRPVEQPKAQVAQTEVAKTEVAPEPTQIAQK
jgi:hypothetical protein